MEQQFSEAACECVLLPRRCKLLSYDWEICLRTDVGPHLGSVIGVLAACISFHCSAQFTPALHPKHQTENSSSHPRTAQAVPSLTAGQEERAFWGHSGVSRITWHGRAFLGLAWFWRVLKTHYGLRAFDFTSFRHSLFSCSDWSSYSSPTPHAPPTISSWRRTRDQVYSGCLTYFQPTAWYRAIGSCLELATGEK